MRTPQYENPSSPTKYSCQYCQEVQSKERLPPASSTRAEPVQTYFAQKYSCRPNTNPNQLSEKEIKQLLAITIWFYAKAWSWSGSCGWFGIFVLQQLHGEVLLLRRRLPITSCNYHQHQYQGRHKDCHHPHHQNCHDRGLFRPHATPNHKLEHQANKSCNCKSCSNCSRPKYIQHPKVQQSKLVCFLLPLSRTRNYIWTDPLFSWLCFHYIGFLSTRWWITRKLLRRWEIWVEL